MKTSKLTKSQKQQHERVYTKDGITYKAILNLRYDDECNNGHNTFSMTVDQWRKEDGRWHEDSFGCQHDLVAELWPEYAHFIKWHLCSSDGPMHYIANTLYHAGDRDCHGLRKGEERQIHNGKSGLPCWILSDVPSGISKYIDAATCPEFTHTVQYIPLMRVGEGKERELDAARRCAIWPDATDAELTQNAERLKAALESRLPSLLTDFCEDMESIGFAW